MARIVVEAAPCWQGDFRARQKALDRAGEGRFFACDLWKVVCVQPPIGPARRNRGDGVGIPTGMDKAQAPQILPKWQGEEPFRPRQCLRRANPETVTKAAMLRQVFPIARPQGAAHRIDAVKQERVEFVIAHDGQCRAPIDQRPDPIKHRPVIGTGDRFARINEIPQKSDLRPAWHQIKAACKAVGIGMKVGDDQDLGQRGPPVDYVIGTL